MAMPARVTHRFLAVAPWIGVPFLLYLFLLRHFWFNAPAWDDYDTIVDANFVLEDARSAREWLLLVWNQHNEHRIAFARLVARTMVKLTGQLDFRALDVIASFAWPGLLVVLWLELRDRVPAMLFAGAALLMLQVSYYEASLVSMSGLSNIGAVSFAFACLYFADRAGRSRALACIAFGIVAAGSQAAGLFALPIAAGVCVLRGRRARAAIIAAFAAVAWAAYFTGYIQPPHHHSILLAATHPAEAAGLFIVNLGSVVAGLGPARTAGFTLLVVFAWLYGRGLWKLSIVVNAWIAFLVASIAAASAARVEFGVIYSSRYAISSTVLLVIAFLAAAALTGPWTRPRAWLAIAACAAASVAIDASSWAGATEFSADGRLLVKAVPADATVHADSFFGVLYPRRGRADRILHEAEKRQVWRARPMSFPPTEVRFVVQPPANVQVGGSVDKVSLDGSRLRLVGWSHIPATLPGRTLLLAQAGEPRQSTLTFRDRVDVAIANHVPVLAYSGFELVLEYASAEDARRAAGALCVFSEAPGHELGRLDGTAGCDE